MVKNLGRQSGIELLKIFALVLIVISHVTQTLTDSNDHILYDDYRIIVGGATTDFVALTLVMFRYFGHFGNAIFFFCSAWFLVDKSTPSKQKVLTMLIDVWVISVAIFFPALLLRHGEIDKGIIFHTFLPTTFSNNWFITCYLLLCLLYPYLNYIISRVDLRGLLRIAIFLAVVYLGIGFLFSAFYTTELVVFLVYYFLIAFIKKYLPSWTTLRAGMLFTAIGLIGNVAAIALTDFLAFHSLSSRGLLSWSRMDNPFIFLFALGMFGIFKNFSFHSKFVNRVSALSMLVYLIHENLIVRIYFRPLLWQAIYLKFGYAHVIGWTLLQSVGYLLASLLVAWIWSKTVQVLTRKLSVKIYGWMGRFARLLERHIFRFLLKEKNDMIPTDKPEIKNETYKKE